MTPLILRDAILNGFKAAFPKVDVGTHAGPFHFETLQRYGARAPAMRVVLTGLDKPSLYNSGQWVVPCHFAVVIITKDVPGLDRDAAVTALATSSSLLVGTNRWGLAGVATPENLDARNEYDETFDKAGLSIWQVAFEQAILMGEDIEAAIGQLSALWVNGEAFVNGVNPLPGDPAMSGGGA